MLEAIPAHVEHMQLVAVPNLRGELTETVFPQREDSKVDKVANLRGQELQPVAVQVEVGDLGEVANLGGDLRQEVLSDDQLLQADAQTQVWIQGHKSVLINLEDCQLGESSNRVRQSFKQVL